MSEHLERAEPDLLRSMLSTFVQALMGAEADAICGAPYGARTDERVNSRNGYRARECSLLRLVGAVLAEQHDEWTEGRRYLGLDVLGRSRLTLTTHHTQPTTTPKEVTSEQLPAAVLSA